MKKHLLSLTTMIVFLVGGVSAQTFEWGTATWNIQDGAIYESVDDLNTEGIVLTYPNPANFALTFLNILAVDYNLYVDDDPEPVKASASAQAGTAVKFDYNYVEGHRYKIETTGAHLAQANLATYTTDTLTIDKTTYTISFIVKGPELVKTIEVEGTMALTIVDQNNQLTYSLIDTNDVAQALDIEDLSQAQIYGLNVNGSYNPYFSDYYDGWRDADGEYTIWSGGYNTYAGHNAYPAVYCVKLTPKADSVYYYFYDYWKEYDPEADESTGGTGMQSRNRAPETSYNKILWNWDNGDGTTTTYERLYRTDEGKDYMASFAIIANKKMVRINATLHFVSQDDYAAYLNKQNSRVYNGVIASGIAMRGQEGTPLAKSEADQTVSIGSPNEDGLVDIIFSGFALPMFGTPTGEMTIPASVTKNADGSISYEASNVPLTIYNGQIAMNYTLSLSGTQESEEATPVIKLSVMQAAAITAVFAETSELANSFLDSHYAILTGISTVSSSSEKQGATYGLDGTRLTAPRKGINIQRQVDGTIRKVLMNR